MLMEVLITNSCLGKTIRKTDFHIKSLKSPLNLGGVPRQPKAINFGASIQGSKPVIYLLQEPFLRQTMKRQSTEI